MLRIVVVLLMSVCATTSSSFYTDDDIDTLAPGPVIDTQYGQLQGSRRAYKLQPYEEFLGIPFAAPPVGDLRWQKPQPVVAWTGVLNATEFSIHCTHLIARLYPLIGMSGETGEDCLYLNIWVPQGVTANEGNPLPVMVFVYGGIYMLGTGEMYPGHALALHGNVIVVTFNYRLNALGFLSTGDDALVGNYGLWDVQAALSWVQENIAVFSGDPSRVTLFGHSAGASLTSHSAISPQTSGLLHRAISISGSSSGYFGVERHPLRTSTLLADVFNCTDVMTSADLVDCLRQQDDKDLDFWSIVAQVAEGRVPCFAPVIDGDIVPMLPVDSWSQGNGQHVDFMTGSTYDDAAAFVLLNPIGLPALGDSLNWADTNESWWRGMRFLLGGTLNHDELIYDILDHYPDMDSPDNETMTLVTTKAMTDWIFGSGSNFEATQHAGGEKGTYHYQFHHRQSFLVGYPDWVNGSHMDDIYSVFGDPFMLEYRRRFLREEWDDTDYTISSLIMSYYTNFAYTGNPNEGPFPVVLQWSEFDPAQQNYLEQAPTFSLKNVDPTTVTNYEFFMDLPSQAEFPPDPTFPLPLSQHRRLTEEDLNVGVERLRQLMIQLLEDDEEMLDVMMTTIDEMVDARNN